MNINHPNQQPPSSQPSTPHPHSFSFNPPPRSSSSSSSSLSSSTSVSVPVPSTSTSSSSSATSSSSSSSNRSSTPTSTANPSGSLLKPTSFVRSHPFPYHHPHHLPSTVTNFDLTSLIEQNNLSEDSCLLVVDHKVYDLTLWLQDRLSCNTRSNPANSQQANQSSQSPTVIYSDPSSHPSPPPSPTNEQTIAQLIPSSNPFDHQSSTDPLANINQFDRLLEKAKKDPIKAGDLLRSIYGSELFRSDGTSLQDWIQEYRIGDFTITNTANPYPTTNTLTPTITTNNNTTTTNTADATRGGSPTRPGTTTTISNINDDHTTPINNSSPTPHHLHRPSNRLIRSIHDFQLATILSNSSYNPSYSPDPSNAPPNPDRFPTYTNPGDHRDLIQNQFGARYPQSSSSSSSLSSPSSSNRHHSSSDRQTLDHLSDTTARSIKPVEYSTRFGLVDSETHVGSSGSSSSSGGRGVSTSAGDLRTRPTAPIMTSSRPCHLHMAIELVERSRKQVADAQHGVGVANLSLADAWAQLVEAEKIKAELSLLAAEGYRPYWRDWDIPAQNKHNQNR